MADGCAVVVLFLEPTSLVFFNKYEGILTRYGITNSSAFYIAMFDDVLGGRKLSNRISHITYDFRTPNSIKITWYKRDILLLALLEEEFNVDDISEPQTPVYFMFNNKRYDLFSDSLIGDILSSVSVNSGCFICSEEV